MDVGQSINPALDIGQIEGAYLQGYGWATMEELVWGDDQHPWVRPSGGLFTKGPGTYKIPSFNDVPADFRVSLLDKSNNRAVHSSKGIGEPPFFLASSAFFAIRNAIKASREETNVTSSNAEEYFLLNLPCTSERIRMACLDVMSCQATSGVGDEGHFQAKGSW
jgi:xanthine dehydrogenase/oxidase